MKIWHWTALAAVLTAVWLGFMIWMSYINYRDNDPRPIETARQPSSVSPPAGVH